MTRLPLPQISARELFERISHGTDGGRYPLAGQWELTCRCNLRCVMCYTDPFNTPEKIRQELTYPEITRILDELQEAGCVELCLTGGEPLARKDFLDIYSYAKGKGFLLTVFTNGTLITPEIADHLCERFDVKPKRAQKDVRRFLQRLLRREMVQEIAAEEIAAS